jgi:DNA-directed RNA polymerase subunit RPC12/RpoP
MEPKCICCGDELEVKRTKTEKPFVSCAPCGFQGFIRGKAGIQKFEAKYGDDWKGAKKTAAEPAAAAPKGKEAPAAKDSKNDADMF